MGIDHIPRRDQQTFLGAINQTHFFQRADVAMDVLVVSLQLFT